MRRNVLAGLSIALLAVAAFACTGVAPSPTPVREGGGAATQDPYDPCPKVDTSGMPSEKAELVSHVCDPNTMPPLAASPVAWANLPYDGPEITASPSIDIMSAYPACDSSTIQVSFAGWTTASDGSATGWLIARTAGSKACVLFGQPRTDLLDASGNVVAGGVAADGPTGPALLQPNLPEPSGRPSEGPIGTAFTQGYGFASFALEQQCGGEPLNVASVRLTMPGGATSIFDAPYAASGCVTGIASVPYVLDSFFESTNEPLPSALSANWLEILPVLPSEATIGQPMHFAVALHNYNSQLPVSLDPCPVYTIELSVVGSDGKEDARITREYTLNCSVAKEVPAGKSVAFEMQVDIPGNLPVTDSLVLLWWFGTSQNIQALPVKEPIRLVAPAG
jgi:hypothetical protein